MLSALRIVSHTATVEPLLRAGAAAEIDTRQPIEDVVDALESIAGTRLAPRQAL